MFGRFPSSRMATRPAPPTCRSCTFTDGRMSPNADFQRVVAASFPPDAKMVVGCKAGGRSLQAAALLEAAGYTSVVDMRGGFHGEQDGFGRVACAGWAGVEAAGRDRGAGRKDLRDAVREALGARADPPTADPLSIRRRRCRSSGRGRGPGCGSCRRAARRRARPHRRPSANRSRRPGSGRRRSARLGAQRLARQIHRRAALLAQPGLARLLHQGFGVVRLGGGHRFGVRRLAAGQLASSAADSARSATGDAAPARAAPSASTATGSGLARQRRDMSRTSRLCGSRRITAWALRHAPRRNARRRGPSRPTQVLGHQQRARLLVARLRALLVDAVGRGSCWKPASASA